MTVNELVLTSLESFEDESFVIQVKTTNGGIKEEVLTKKLYSNVYNYEVENYYLDVNKETGKPYISMKLEGYDY